MKPLKPNIGSLRYQRVRTLRTMLTQSGRTIGRGAAAYATNRRGNVIDLSFTSRGKVIGVSVLDVAEIKGGSKCRVI